MKITIRGVEALKPPETGQVDYWDTGLTGFGIRVSAGGRRTWTLMYRHGSRKRRLKLGTYPAMTLAVARDRAGAALRQVAEGEDPAGLKQAEKRAETFAELADDYLERYAKKRKRTWRLDDRALKKDVLPAIGSRKVKDVERADVRRLLQNIVARGATIQANRTHALVSKIFNWAISEDVATVNPVRGIEKPGVEQQRDRILTDDEIRAVWLACDQETPSFGIAVKLRLLTAQRSGEVTRMRWQDIEGEWWTIPAEHAKNGLAHRVPLSLQARVEIDAMGNRSQTVGWVFRSSRQDGPFVSNWRSIGRIRRHSGVDFVMHDLRRTAASRMTGDLGVNRLTVSKILNHVESGVTSVYDRHSYDAEKRQALDAWGRRLEQIISDESTADETVVPLRSG
jgi:integrase